jgi:hypothetical protein
VRIFKLHRWFDSCISSSQDKKNSLTLKSDFYIFFPKSLERAYRKFVKGLMDRDFFGTSGNGRVGNHPSPLNGLIFFWPEFQGEMILSR